MVGIAVLATYVVIGIVGYTYKVTPIHKEVPNVVGMECKKAVKELNKNYFTATCQNEEEKIVNQSLTGEQETYPLEEKWTVVELTDEKMQKEENAEEKDAIEKRLIERLIEVDGKDVKEQLKILKSEGYDVRAVLKNDVDMMDQAQFILDSIDGCQDNLKDGNCVAGVIISHSVQDGIIYLTFNTYDTIKEEEAVKTHKKGMDEETAMTLCEDRFTETYPYNGSKIHYTSGDIRWHDDIGKFVWDPKATIVNGFGTKADIVIECTVTPQTAESGLVSIN